MKYAANEIVVYDLDVAKGVGKIVGIATAELPVIGYTYIVEDLSGNFPSKLYPYSHLAIPGPLLKVKT